MNTNDIIGKTVTGVSLDKEKQYLRFSLDDGTQHVWSAIGDCCSNSWFESVESFDFGGKVLRVEYGDEREEEVGEPKIDFLTVFSERGRLCLEMRNASNGYYSGYIVVDTVPLDDSHGSTFPLEKQPEWTNV